jgi:hypothetical protein
VVAIVAAFDLEMQQFNVVHAFGNGNAYARPSCGMLSSEVIVVQDFAVHKRGHPKALVSTAFASPSLIIPLRSIDP